MLRWTSEDFKKLLKPEPGKIANNGFQCKKVNDILYHRILVRKEIDENSKIEHS